MSVRINLRTKVFLPLIVLMAVLIGYLYMIWMPRSLAHMDNQYQDATERHLESVIEGMIPLLLGHELDAIHENLSALMKKNSDWVSIRLADAEDRQLYPIGNISAEGTVAHSQNIRLLTMRITYLDTNLGTLSVNVDLEPHLTEWKREFYNAVSVMLIIIAVIVVSIGLVLERQVITPVRALEKAAQELAQGKFDTLMLKAGDDEVGHLVASFNKMSGKLSVSYDLLKQSRDTYSTLYNQTPVLLHSADGADNILEVNDFWLKTLGYRKEEVVGRNISEFYTEESQEYAAGVVRPAFLRDGYCRDVPYQFVKKNGELEDVLLSATAERDESGNIVRIFSVIEDVTERKKIENRLRASLEEKELLLHEVHHRVKNNLQVIISLLELQLEYLGEKRPGEIFSEIKNRIKSMSLVHENLYLSKDVSRVNLREYVTTLANNLYKSYNVGLEKIALRIEMDDISLNIDTAIPFGLLINELITNALKYAFPGDRRGELSVLLREAGVGADNRKLYDLEIRDNGTGIPESLDLKGTRTLGLYLVTTLVEHQLQGTIKMDRTNGTGYVIRFRELKYRKRI